MYTSPPEVFRSPAAVPLVVVMAAAARSVGPEVLAREGRVVGGLAHVRTVVRAAGGGIAGTGGADREQGGGGGQHRAGGQSFDPDVVHFGFPCLRFFSSFAVDTRIADLHAWLIGQMSGAFDDEFVPQSVDKLCPLIGGQRFSGQDGVDGPVDPLLADRTRRPELLGPQADAQFLDHSGDVADVGAHRPGR